MLARLMMARLMRHMLILLGTTDEAHHAHADAACGILNWMLPVLLLTLLAFSPLSSMTRLTVAYINCRARV